jgi:hypothetical protein
MLISEKYTARKHTVKGLPPKYFLSYKASLASKEFPIEGFSRLYLDGQLSSTDGH